MKNQVFTGTPTGRRFSLCPTTVKSGDAVLLGSIPAFALDDYQAVSGGTTFLLNGSFNVTVVANSVLSPPTTHAINPGDKVYYDGGSLDTATNVTSGGTIDANSSTGKLFGNLDPNGPGITAGTTSTSAVVEIVTGA